MKRFVGLLTLVLLLAAALPLAAQSKDNPIFVKTVPIMKIYGHPLGYRILYEKSNLEVGELYVPVEWFARSGGKGDIVWGTDSAYPYLSIFWKDGKFDHVRLYLREEHERQELGEAPGRQRAGAEVPRGDPPGRVLKACSTFGKPAWPSPRRTSADGFSPTCATGMPSRTASSRSPGARTTAGPGSTWCPARGSRSGWSTPSRRGPSTTFPGAR